MSRTMRRIRSAPVAFACVGALAAAACRDDVTGPGTVSVGATGLAVVEQPLVQGQRSRRVALIGLGSESDIVVPASGGVGQAVTVRVTTYGGGCVYDDTTAVKVVSSEADVVPYQMIYSPTAEGACTDILRVTPRAVSLVFSRVGTATVTITGRSRPEGGIVRVVRRVVVEQVGA